MLGVATAAVLRDGRHDWQLAPRRHKASAMGISASSLQPTTTRR